MGMSSSERELREKIKESNIKQFFSAYKSIKNILKKYIYQGNKQISKEVYLINPKTVENFIQTLGDVFDLIEKKDELDKKEDDLKKIFEDYKIKDRNVEIYSNYDKCQEIMKNKEKNEFIIVDRNFIDNLDIKNPYYKELKIIKAENKCIDIKFPISKKIIYAKEIENKKGFFMFYEKKENNTDKNETKNINVQINKKKVIIKNNFDLMVLNLCYCLVKINSLKYCFLCNGDMINNDKNISKIFFDLIQQNNINDGFDSVELLKGIVKSKNLENIKNILPFLFQQMNIELKRNKETSIIGELFNYQYTSFYICPSCSYIMDKSDIYNCIIFSLKDVYHFKNSTNINIFDCFDYFSSNELINNNQEVIKCNKCENISTFSSKKINSVNDILTIILDSNEKEENNQNQISFVLNFNKINLNKYFMNNFFQNNYEFELIALSNYIYENGKYISYHKEYPDKWFCFDGSKEKEIQLNEINYQNPVLLFYKKII